MVSTALFLASILAGIILLLGVLFSRPLSTLLTGNPQYARLTVVVLLNSALTSVNTVAMAVFRAQKWSGRYTVVSVIAMLLSLGVTIYLVVFRGLNIAGPIFGILVSGIASTLLSLWLIRHHLRLAFSWIEIRKMTSYGLPFIPGSFITFLQNSGDRLVIQTLLGSTAVGVYVLAQRLAQLIQVLIINPFSIIEPAIIFDAEHDLRAKEFYARILTYYLLITSFVGLGISALVGNVLQLIATNHSEYLAAIPIVSWICLAYVLFGARGLVSVGLGLKRQTQWFPVSLAIGAIFYFLLMFVLVPAWGILGAGISLVIGNLALVIFRYWISQRIYPIALEFDRILKLLVVTLLIFLLAGTIDTLGLSELVGLLLKFLIVTIGFPILLLLMRFPDALEFKKAHQLSIVLRHKFSSWPRQIKCL